MSKPEKPLRLRQEPYSGSTDSDIVNADTGEPIARISGKHDKTCCIAYPDKVAKAIIRAVNNRPNLLRQLDDYEEKLGKQIGEMRKMRKAGTLDLRHLSRSPDRAFTHVRFEDYEFAELLSEKDKEEEGRRRTRINWLEMGVATLQQDNEPFLGARLGGGVTDREHDAAYLVHIKLIGIKFTGCFNNVSHFEAYLAPTPGDIRIWTPDFKPEEAEGAYQCDLDCYNKGHLMIEKFVPPMYEYAHLVTGKKVCITMGPCWAEDKDE